MSGHRSHSFILSICLGLATSHAVADVPASDRLAVERVFHRHRQGNKPPAESDVPAPVAEALVRLDRRKETALLARYGIAVTDEMVAAEVARIDATSQDPATLAELKSALGNDPSRFARAVARPLVVDRLLRERFARDPILHDAALEQAKQAREQLLNGHAVPGMTEVVWRLPAPVTRSAAGPYAVDALAEIAAPENPTTPIGFPFSGLPDDLQTVVRSQLRHPGDVSQIIETPTSFLLLTAKSITETAVVVASLTIPKLGFEEWLASQPG